LAADAAVCIAAVIALAVARFGAARCVAGFKDADPSEHSRFPLSFDANYRPPWRLHGLRVSIAERVAKGSATQTLEVMPDLIVGALAQRNIDRAIDLLESERHRGAFGVNDVFLLTYLYCLNGSVDKAETLIADSRTVIKNDSSVDWLWQKSKKEFGFHPPTSNE
jgi:hypothetical protein